MSIKGMLERSGIFSDGSRVRIPGLIPNAYGRGKTIYVDPAYGSAAYSGLQPDRAKTSLSTTTGALSRLTSTSGNYHDEVRLIAGTTSLSLAAGVTWSYNHTHLRGEGPRRMLNNRARIGHSANFATMLTVSGYGNEFENLYFMHGRGSATNTTLLDVTGARNTFVNCHFGGPFHATEAGTAAYRLVKLYNSETEFRNCVFGADTAAPNTTNSFVEFGNAADPPRAIFEDCLFVCIAANAGFTFLNVVAGAGAGLAIFRNCQFINISGTSLTYGIDGTGLNNFKLAFDNRCFFAGCTDVVASTYESKVFLGPSNTPINQVTGGASVALFNGLACTPDVS